MANVHIEHEGIDEEVEFLMDPTEPQKCASCHGTGLETDVEGYYVKDDVCPICYGRGTVN